MSSLCRVLILAIAFLVALAISQILAQLPNALLVLSIFALCAYLVGVKEEKLLPQIVAAGIIVGYLKWSIG
jgi:ABC-type multidrug transport system permease subunit